MPNNDGEVIFDVRANLEKLPKDLNDAKTSTKKAAEQMESDITDSMEHAAKETKTSTGKITDAMEDVETGAVSAGKAVEKIDADTRQLMTEQFREGEQEAEAVAGAEPAASVPDVHFFGVNTPKMERLMQDVVQVEQTAETAALRTMDDVYRRTVNRAQLAMAAGETTLTKAIDMAVREFLEKGLNSIVYRDGRHVDIADYVRMVLRTTSTRAQLQGKSKRFAELGYDTVLISQYGGCSETCEPWQGRAYIDDVFTIWNGEINGDSGKSMYCGKWFPLLSSAIRGGLFHPNCRHTMSLYIDGVTKIPPPIPAEQIRKQRELEQKQRVMERKIRKLKRLEAGTQDPQAVKEYGRKARAAQQELKAFVDEHRDVLKRDYEREKYYGGGVDKSGGSGIITNEGMHSIGDAASKPYTSAYSFEPKVTTEVRKAFNEEYQKATEMYGRIDTVSGVDVMTTVSTDEGNYNDNSRWISLRHAEKKDGLKIMASVAQEKYKAGKWSTGHPRHAMRHEIGHAIQLHHQLYDANWSKKCLKISEVLKKAIADEDGYMMPSSYVGEDFDEFVSECVAASYLNPKKQSKTVKEIFAIITGGV